jgi:hypothetical protein
MTAMWVPCHEDLLRACVVSPHVFAHLVDRLCESLRPINTVWRPRRGSVMCTATWQRWQCLRRYATG